MKSNNLDLQAASSSVEDQVSRVATEIARRVLSSSRPVFSIIEWSANDGDLPWPRRSSTNEDGHLCFLDSITGRLTNGGTWCVVEGSNSGIRAELYAGKSCFSKSESSIATQLSHELSKLISDGDEIGVCRLVAILSSEFPWVGFLVRNTDPLCVATLLRHCEYTFAAVDARLQHYKQLRQSLKSWRQARIPLGSAFLVGAA